MATFRKRGNKWQVQIRIQSQNPISRSFTLKTDAEKWAKQTEAAIERGDFETPKTERQKITLAELLDRYERVVTSTKKGQGPETYRIAVLRRHAISAVKVSEITPSAVCGFRDDRLREVSPSSVRRELAILQHCLEIARKEWGSDIRSNPVADVTKPSENLSRQRRVSADELVSLRMALNQSRNATLGNAVLFAIHTGMRRGELLSIKWRNLNFVTRTAHLIDTKNGHPRTVPLSPSAVAAMPSRPPGAVEDDRVFPLSANALRLSWERLKKRAGIQDLRFHDLRHEAISRFFEMGLSIPEVSLISGHRDTRMLLRYTHLRPEDVAKKLDTLSDRRIPAKISSGKGV